MTWTVMLWLASSFGAILFFAAGALVAGRTTSRREALALGGAQRQAADLQEELSLVMQERSELLADIEQAHREQQQLRLSTESSAAEREQLRTEYDRALADQRKLHADAERALSEYRRLRVEAERSLATQGELRAALEAAHRSVVQLQADSARLATALRDSTAREERLKVQAAARHEQELQADRLRQQLTYESTERVAAVAAKDALADEVERLRAQTEELRARAVIARAPNGTTLVTMDKGGMSRGNVFQSLVERVYDLADIRCAVIADDLGLVVASHGELADEIAAVGALFGRAGVQAQRVLPLRNVEQVTLEDDQGVVLTLRPLRTDDLGAGELALLTLAVGAGPDQRLVNKLIDEGPSARARPGRRSLGASP